MIDQFERSAEASTNLPLPQGPHAPPSPTVDDAIRHGAGEQYSENFVPPPCTPAKSSESDKGSVTKPLRDLTTKLMSETDATIDEIAQMDAVNTDEQTDEQTPTNPNNDAPDEGSQNDAKDGTKGSETSSQTEDDSSNMSPPAASVKRRREAKAKAAAKAAAANLATNSADDTSDEFDDGVELGGKPDKGKK